MIDTEREVPILAESNRMPSEAESSRDYKRRQRQKALQQIRKRLKKNIELNEIEES